jgi:dTDP-4-amino-4,6-dideoxygalactose transaminase
MLARVQSSRATPLGYYVALPGSNSLMKNEVIPFLDLKRQSRPIETEIENAFHQVLESCHFASGPFVETFEAEFARYCGVRHCVCVNSGTSALHLAMIACEVGPGDEVITVPFTFISTVWVISYVGAQPVFVDIEPETCTMDVSQVETAITPRTRAVLPVHLYGQMADLTPLKQICERHNLALIEDAAQAHGAEYFGQRAGSVGEIGCFSFYPTKNLGAVGEGGALTTNDDTVAARLRALRDHAQLTKYRHEELGFNYRMDGLQAAALSVKLRYLDQWNSRRTDLATMYHSLLSDTPLTLPFEAENRRHVWHLYVARHPKRDRLRQGLLEAGIETGLHYPVPVHLQPAYAALKYRSGDCPVAEQAALECLSLPMYPELTESEQIRIAETVKTTSQRL